MSLETLFFGGLLQDTLSFIGCNPDVANLSTHPGHWVVTRPGICVTATLHSVDVNINWLPHSSFTESLDRFKEGMDEKGTEIGAQ